MWLKKLVALSMIITLVGMNTIAAIGILTPSAKVPGLSLAQPEIVVAPVIDFTAPESVDLGSFGALKWAVTGKVDSCTASGDWSGSKTPFGSESTGRLPSEGVKTYTLTCANTSGTVQKTVHISVKAGAVATPSSPSSPGTPSTPAQPVYCQGASPCYGPREVASHASPGNCWGYNGNRVINISGFDAAFHQAKSGISSIEVGGVCGVNLAGALSGSVGAGGQTRNHNNSSKSNADRNMIPYFVGYFDASKP